MDLAQTCCVALFWSQTHENHTTGTPEPTGGNTDDKYAMIESMRPFNIQFDYLSISLLFSRNEELLQQIQSLKEMNVSFKRKNIASNVRKPSSESLLIKREKKRYLTASDFNRIDIESSTCSSVESTSKTNENNPVIQYQPVNFANGNFVFTHKLFPRTMHLPRSSLYLCTKYQVLFVKDPEYFLGISRHNNKLHRAVNNTALFILFIKLQHSKFNNSISIGVVKCHKVASVT